MGGIQIVNLYMYNSNDIWSSLLLVCKYCLVYNRVYKNYSRWEISINQHKN